MKVAVVSEANRQVGKTALSLMLANAYPSAVGKESVYVRNHSLDEALGLEAFSNNVVSIEKSISVITSLSRTDAISNENIVDYCYKPANAQAMLFDIYSENVPKQEAHDNFMNVISKLGNRFIVMDLNGNPKDEYVKKMIDECNTTLYCFRPIKRECDAAREYYDSLDEDEKLRTKLVCTMWDMNGVKKKEIQDFMKIRTNSILWFPYHVNISRTMFESRLCLLNKLMIDGRDNCLSLRQPLKDILSYLCDTPSFKVVKEVSKWKY